jgi:outer membrane lipoprotein-sorting protein
MRLKVKLVLSVLLLMAMISPRSAFAAPADDLKSVLDRLNTAAANLHTTSADVVFDTIDTDPLPDTDEWKGVFYYQRKTSGVGMAVHFNEHNRKPAGKAYTFIDGVFKLFEPGINQVTTLKGAAKYESYIILGFGASGKDLQAKWDIADLGPETIDGVKTEKLELVAKDPDVRKNIQKVTIWQDIDHAVSLKQVFVLSATSTYVCHYANFKFNGSLPSDAFTFKTDSNTVLRTQ